jgi:hypothetical protein
LKHHPVPMKRAVSPAAMAILRVACAGEEAAAKKDDAGLDRPTVSAVVAPVVERTVPLFKGLAARTDRGDSVDIRARVRALLRTQDTSEGTMIKAGEARIRPTAMHHAFGGRPKWRQPQVLVIGAGKEERDSRVSK